MHSAWSAHTDRIAIDARCAFRRMTWLVHPSFLRHSRLHESLNRFITCHCHLPLRRRGRPVVAPSTCSGSSKFGSPILIRGKVLGGHEYNSPVSERPRAGAHIGEASGAGVAISGRSRAFDHPSPGAVPPVIFLTSRAAHARLDLWKRIKYHGSGVQTGGNWLTGGRTPNEDVACCAVFR